MAKNPSLTSNDAIARRLKALRRAYGMSQVEFCEMVGIKPQAWNNYEQGRNRISIDPALALVEHTGVSLDWLYYGDQSNLPLRISTKLSRPESETA